MKSVSSFAATNVLPNTHLDYQKIICRLVEALEQQGIETTSLLDRASLSKSALYQSGAAIRGRDFVSIITVISDAKGDAFLGLTQRPLKPGSSDLQIDLALACSTLGAALRQMVKLLSLLAEGIELQVDFTDSEMTFSVRQLRPDLDPDDFLADYLLVLMHRTLSWLVGHLVPIKRVEVNWSENINSGRLSSLLMDSWSDNCGRSAIVFNRKYSALPIVRTHQEWRQHVQMVREGILNWPHEETGIKSKLLAQFRLALSSAEPDITIGKIASSLCLTAQTLRRQLQDEGTSYQDLLDDLRRDMAIDLLYMQELSVAEVAERLGFSEPRSFSRAFKTWTGLTPSRYLTQVSE